MMFLVRMVKMFKKKKTEQCFAQVQRYICGRRVVIAVQENTTTTPASFGLSLPYQIPNSAPPCHSSVYLTAPCQRE
jgi:hypothetical protein